MNFSPIRAEELKGLGNESFVEGDFDEAIQFYTESIVHVPTNPVCYSNRAQAYIKTESYGLAIKDATTAIYLDPSNVKAYYRRAVASTAIIKHQDALGDFKKVVELVPNDAGARRKLEECKKIVRRLAFEKAIEVEAGLSVSQSLEIEQMPIENSYDGPELDISFVDPSEEDKKKEVTRRPVINNMSTDFIEQTIERFKDGKKIPKKYLYAIVMQALNIFYNEPTMVEVGVEKGEKLTVCGDTHGQFYDLLEIFRKNGKPSDTHMYLFNGDFVDRGSWSTEIAIILYCYKILYPTKFYLNRGNHETDNMNKVYGFEGECKSKYTSDSVFSLFSESFSALPLATLIGEKFLVVHGGLFSNDDVTLDDIRKVNRFAEKQPGQEGLMMEMLWTDPQDEAGRGPSKRGVGIQFGPDVTDSFCKKNGLEAVIRSHEVRMDGYSQEHDGKLITVFSAPNYCDAQGNKGAYINIETDLKLQFETFTAVPHPNIKPMAYASNLMF